MAIVNTGIKRSLTVTITKLVEGTVIYTHTYYGQNFAPYSVSSGLEITDSALALISDAAFAARLTTLKEYINTQNTGIDWINDIISGSGPSESDLTYCVLPTTTTTSTTLAPNEIIEEYGYLYNWYAVTNVNNIANTGWHVPSYSEWNILINYLVDNDYGYGGSGQYIAKSMASTSGWAVDGIPENVGNDQGSNNSSGFNALQGGYRGNDNLFYAITTNFTAWSSTENLSIEAWYLRLLNNSGYANTGSLNKKYGISIRLVKDSTSLSNGQTGTYTGNDGTIYNTICIGTQEWISKNLKEIEYTDHSIIPILQDNTDWTDDIVGARCYYVL